jgi:hypothetical protein
MSAPKELSFINSLLGGVVGFAWGAAWCFVILFSISLIPEKISILSQLREEVESSKSFQIIRYIARGYQGSSVLTQMQYLSKVINYPEALDSLREDTAFQKVLENEKIQGVISDKETLRQIRERDIVKLMRNPRIKELLSDSELIKKLQKVNLKEFVDKWESAHPTEHSP